MERSRHMTEAFENQQDKIISYEVGKLPFGELPNGARFTTCGHPERVMRKLPILNTEETGHDIGGDKRITGPFNAIYEGESNRKQLFATFEDDYPVIRKFVEIRAVS